MAATWLITIKELRTQLRRGTVLILGFVAPLTLAFIMNLVFGGLNDPDAPVTFDVGVVDHDGGEMADGFVATLHDITASGLVDLTTYDDEPAARDAVDAGDIGALWVIPEGFSTAVSSGRDTSLTVVGDVDSPTTASVARSIADRYATGVGTSTLAALVAVDTGVAEPSEIGEVADEVAGAAPIARLDRIESDTSVLDPTTSLTAGMAIFFVYFTAGIPLLSILEERTGGTLARLLAAPIPAASIRAGKTIASILLGTVSLACLMVASSVLMGADWGPPLPALLLALAAVIAATGVMSVAGSAARSAEQAGNVQSIVAIVLGILGGSFVPIPGGNTGVLGTLQKLTPNGWFLDGLGALQNGDTSEAARTIVVLLAIGVAAGAVGLQLSRTALRR
ncbi:MAG: ABC transporter permease [Acidimicrobiia bacterium]|nr:ABC transporter permease [Acidimicrobiia bacterium]